MLFNLLLYCFKYWVVKIIIVLACLVFLFLVRILYFVYHCRFQGFLFDARGNSWHLGRLVHLQVIIYITFFLNFFIKFTSFSLF